MNRRASSILAYLAIALLTVTACGRSAAPRAEAQPGSQAAEPNPQATADYFRGKTITIIVGLGPGGGFDTTARLLAKHMGKHLPGNPNVVVENMEGAGSLLATNHLYNVAKPDGLTFGTFNELQVINQLSEGDGVQFDARKFSWLGSAQRAATTCTIRADSPYKTAQDLTRTDLPPLVLGGTGPGANTDDFPKMMNALAGTNIKLVSGYRGTADIRLATESKEVDGLCWTFDSVASTAPKWLEDNFINVPIYQAREKNAKILERWPTATRLEDFVQDENAKKLVRVVAAPQEISKPFAAPPGVPANILGPLQKAYMETMTDPELIADSNQARLEMAPRPAAEVEQIIADILSLDRASVQRLAQIRG
jgi:tripartite-type tricarboxylate transporter receptor subunit TctC